MEKAHQKKCSPALSGWRKKKGRIGSGGIPRSRLGLAGRIRTGQPSPRCPPAIESQQFFPVVRSLMRVSALLPAGLLPFLPLLFLHPPVSLPGGEPPKAERPAAVRLSAAPKDWPAYNYALLGTRHNRGEK